MTASPTSDIDVQLEDGVRLMSAALAATTYPDQAQARRPHGTHAHARATRKQLGALADHAAVRALQELLDESAPLEAIFTLALVLRLPNRAVSKPPRWMPPHWDAQLNDFYAAGGLAEWWQNEDAAWQKSLDDVTQVFENVRFKPFLQPYLGEIKERLVFVPNISYPTDHPMGLRRGSDLVCIVPPRLAWGDNPPWPYDEDPAYVYRSALELYGRVLMSTYLRSHAAQIAQAERTPLPVTDSFKSLYPTWAEQFTHLFVAGAVAIFLEDHVSPAEASAHVLMERKVHHLEILPGVINVLRRYAAELASGRYHSLLDLLPDFSQQLRVANPL